MAGKILKEISIVLLLCLAIILILSVLLYDCAPNTKVLPEKVAYVTPDIVKEELNKAEGVDDSSIVLTYQVDSNDLNNYKRINNYVPGKPNPFSSYQKDTTTQTKGTTTNSESSTQIGTSQTTTNLTWDAQNQNTTEQATNQDATTSGQTTTAPNESPYTNHKGTK